MYTLGAKNHLFLLPMLHAKDLFGDVDVENESLLNLFVRYKTVLPVENESR